jgi:hypothetical protein
MGPDVDPKIRDGALNLAKSAARSALDEISGKPLGRAGRTKADEKPDASVV